MRGIEIEFESGYKLLTVANGTDDEILSYYVGQVFNLGCTVDKLDKAIAVKFIEKE